MREKLSVDKDSEISATSLRVSLVCPVRMTSSLHYYFVLLIGYNMVITMVTLPYYNIIILYYLWVIMAIIWLHCGFASFPLAWQDENAASL